MNKSNTLIIDKDTLVTGVPVQRGDLVKWGYDIFMITTNFSGKKYELTHYTSGYSLYNYEMTLDELTRIIKDNSMEVYRGNTIKLSFGTRIL